MLSRLTTCLIAAFALSGAAFGDPVWTPKDGETLKFDVLRNGKPFGAHTVEFEREGETLTVKTDIDLKVKIGPFTPFKYAHKAEEVWRKGRMTSLSGRTIKDGDTLTVEAEAEGDLLNIDGTEFEGEAPLGLAPSSHWNKSQLDGDVILSTENGELLPVEAEFMGVEAVEAGGETVEARKYLLKSDLDVYLWYDDAGRWVKCSFEARGQEVEYVLRAVDGANDA